MIGWHGMGGEWAGKRERRAAEGRSESLGWAKGAGEETGGGCLLEGRRRRQRCVVEEAAKEANGRQRGQ